MNKHRLAKCFHWTINILATVIVLTALLLNVSRLSVLVISNHRHFVEKWLSAALHQTVQIQTMTANWAALNPGLTVNNVLLKNPNDQQSYITMKRLTVSVDILRSILHWKLLPKRLVIEGVNLDIDNSHGRPSVRGILMSSQNFRLSNDATALTSVVSWMLSEGDVRIQDVNIDYHSNDNKTYYLRNMHVRVINHYFRHQIYGSAFINKASPTKLYFAAKLRDIDFTDEKFNADFYVSIRNVQLDQWASSLWMKPYLHLVNVKKGEANLQLWGEWKKTHVVDLQGRWKLKNVTVQLPTNKEELTVNDMLVNFFWKPADHNLYLQVDSLLLSFPNQYKAPLHFKNIQTTMIWNKDKADFSLYVPYYQIALGGLRSNGQFYLNIPNNGKPTIDLLSALQLSTFSELPTLIPDRHRSAGLNRWFQQAFLNGGISSGTIVYRGFIENNPLQNHGAHLAAVLHVNDGALSYQSGWPPITSLNGDIIFRERRVSVDFPTARLGASPVQTLNAYINDFMSPKLNINAEIHSDVSALHAFLKNSPILSSTSSAQFPVKGSVSLKMGMQMDFTQPSFTIQSQGDVAAIGNAFAFQVQSAHPGVHIGLKGILNVDALKSQWRLDLLKGISGKTPFVAAVDVDGRHAVRFDFKSNMKGIALSGFPNFVDKHADVLCPVKLHVDMPPNNDLRIALHYQDDILLRLVANRRAGHLKFLSGEIFVGKNPSPNYPSFPGFVVQGDIPTFNWVKWKPIIVPFIHEKNGAIVLPKLFGLPLRYVEFHFGTMNAYHHHVNDMRLKLIPRPNDWMFQLKSPMVAGTLFLPNYKGGTWAGRLDYLTLPKMKKEKSKKKRKPLNIDPSVIPPIDIQINKLVYGDANYGEVELRTRPNRYGMTINQVSIKSELITLDLKGKWEKQQLHQLTEISGYFATKNLGQLLLNWDIKDAIAKGRGQATFQLSWPDALDQMKSEKLSGHVNFNFRHGRILKIDKSKTKELSIGRIVNAFSLAELPRRLTLHFGDITAKGLEFRKLKGELRIKNGICKMKDTLLDSPVAKLNISGTVNFSAKNYDLNVSVAPYVTSSVPLIIGIAGGPVAGAIAWVVNKIAAPEIGKAIGFVYHAQGSWDTSKNVKLPPPTKTIRT